MRIRKNETQTKTHTSHACTHRMNVDVEKTLTCAVDISSKFIHEKKPTNYFPSFYYNLPVMTQFWSSHLSEKEAECAISQEMYWQLEMFERKTSQQSLNVEGLIEISCLNAKCVRLVSSMLYMHENNAKAFSLPPALFLSQPCTCSHLFCNRLNKRKTEIR